MPAPHLRLCGDLFKSDDFFLESAQHEADRLIEYFKITPEKSLLDLGCGYGRLPIGILNRIGAIRYYQGVDVNKEAISWCRKYIERDNPSFKFLHTNVSSARYNPDGEPVSTAFLLPFPDQSFDIIYLFSVFSHMEVEDVKVYLKEFERLLAPSGHIFFTGFVEENVPDISVNPEGYRRKSWNGELHCVRYNKTFIENIITESGFKVDWFEYESIVHGQSAYYLSRR